ncbi:MAG TPA: hypothetical protein VMT23_02960 [Candidatus Binatia bacterium]|nr:hypothetical protein [Candidatus Binatia bacterium]
MKTDIDIKSIKLGLEAFAKKASRHISFAATITVLLAYILVVWQISKLSTAEPSHEAETNAQTQIPGVDQTAINQIKTLEQNNTQVHSLFESARNNPFQE